MPWLLIAFWLVVALGFILASAAFGFGVALSSAIIGFSP
tara:strand:- start:467 stop:583 length:117 start_codon:yes stop_codon:yes gene_type:complete